MLKKGDSVRFKIGADKQIYKVSSDEFVMNGVTVVYLEGYSGEVNTAYLERIETEVMDHGYKRILKKAVGKA